MRWLLLVIGAAAAATPRAIAQPAPRTITVRVTRAIGGFDPQRLRRGLRQHAATCRQRGAFGTVRLTLVLRDEPGRRGLRVQAARGDAQLRGCLVRALPAAAWPTGSLDGTAEFAVTIRVAP